jgi:diguanylate cyclase (GGDEF)-like protein
MRERETLDFLAYPFLRNCLRHKCQQKKMASMLKVPVPENEESRLNMLLRYEILDTPAERDFDDITLMAAQICQTPISLISLVDANRQWFKSTLGISQKETPRELAVCAHAIMNQEPLIIPDLRKDERFKDFPMVTSEPFVRFYAGAPLWSKTGHALGSLCVLDRVPRNLNASQIKALEALGRQVVSQLDLRKTASQLARAERFGRCTIDALAAHVAIIDEKGIIVAVNRAWREFAQANPGLGPAVEVGGNYLAVCDLPNGPYSDEASLIGDGIRKVLNGGQNVFASEYPCHTPTLQRWFVVRVSRFSSEGPTYLVILHADISERRLAENRLRYDSRHDALTGLPNRVLFAERIERCIGLSKRGKYSFAVLFLDLDRFKIINDSLGHAAGDKLLQTISERLLGCLRESDAVGVPKEWSTVARMGGDEFTILLEQLRRPEDAVRVAERILQTIGKRLNFDGNELTTTASIGIVACGQGCVPYTSAKDVLRDADAAMYRAKALGRDQYLVFDQKMHEEAVNRLSLERDLRRAIERDELVLHYQPILTLSNQRVAGVEALVRWRRNGELVNPADFIPIAEETNLIVAIGRWVLEESCRQMARWQRMFPALDSLSMSINISRRQLCNDDLVADLERVLKEAGLTPASIILEITESAIMDDPETAKRTMDRLKLMGVNLAMDDFGTGYSSLSCLRRFSIDLLKIDRSFIQKISDRRDASVVQTIVNLAQNLDMKVIAEGVETREQMLFLQSCRCEMAQGYLISKPLVADAAEEFINRKEPLILLAYGDV